jgi:hypothetical protein
MAARRLDQRFSFGKREKDLPIQRPSRSFLATLTAKPCRLFLSIRVSIRLTSEHRTAVSLVRKGYQIGAAHAAACLLCSGYGQVHAAAPRRPGIQRRGVRARGPRSRVAWFN